MGLSFVWRLTELFLVLFGSCFWCLCNVHLSGGLGGSSGGHGVDFGAIWGAVGIHFGDFFKIRWIFKNVCLTTLKQYYLRSGRALDRDFFVSCFWIYTFRIFLIGF